MNTQKWTPEMIQAWQNTRSLVRSVLATGGQDQATDDVWQSVWLAANQSIPSFDPKFGRFTHWINGVAWNTAKRHLKSNAQDMNIRSAAADESRSGANSPFDVVAADFTEAFAENADHWEEVASILRCTRAVMNPVFFDRVMTLYLRHDGCVRDAARQMQVSEPMLRECQREFIDTARTVHRATQLHWHHYTTGADPTLSLIHI